MVADAAAVKPGVRRVGVHRAVLGAVKDGAADRGHGADGGNLLGALNKGGGGGVRVGVARREPGAHPFLSLPPSTLYLTWYCYDARISLAAMGSSGNSAMRRPSLVSSPRSFNAPSA